MTMHDFKAFRGDHTIHFDCGGLVFVGGDNLVNPRLKANGAAKSSLWDAFCWCLTGVTPLGLHNPDIVPWRTGGKPSVTLSLQRDGKKYIIQRTHAPNRLLLNDKETSQETIYDLIGMNLDLLVNTTLLAQGKPLFFDRKPEAKMQLFSDTLMLTRWDDYSEKASERTKLAEQRLQRLNEDKAVIEGTLNEMAELLRLAKERAEGWAAEARVKAKAAAKRIAQLERDHEARNNQLGFAQLKLDGAETELASLEREAKKLANEIAGVSTTITRAEMVYEATQRQIKECREELEELNQAKTCPTCGQPIKPKNVSTHRDHLTTKLAKLEASATATVPRKLLNARRVLQERSANNESYISSFQTKADSAEAEISRLQPEVAALKAQLDECRRIAKEEPVNPFTEQIKALQKKQRDLTTELAQLEKDVLIVSRKAERNRFWIKGFKELKLQLIDDVLEELGIVTAGMLEAVGLVDWEVRYDIERETKSGNIQRKLNIQINSPESDGFVRWESWSGSEKQRLKLVGALALSDVLLAQAGVETNLEILDEPAVYWSSEGIEELCIFLAERAKAQSKTIFYTEHNVVESTHFSDVITVVHDVEGSCIRGQE